MDFLKQRLIGATFLLILATAIIPAIFDGETLPVIASQYTDLNAHPYQVALNQHLSQQNPRATSRHVSYSTENNIESTAEAWSVRVASFSDPQVAQQLEQRLQQQGYEAYLQASEGHLYNVLVGPELVASNAYTVKQQLEQQLQLKGVVVPYEPVMYVSNDVQRG